MIKNKIVKIDGVEIGYNRPIPVIAEIGVNHLGNLSRAKKMVDLANDGGADFIKFQTYVAERRYDLNKNPKAEQFIKLTKEWQLLESEEEELWTYARKQKAKIFTSVYDPETIKFAEKLENPVYKVAAFEISNTKLIAELIKTKKPLIISCGMTNIQEIKKNIKILEENNVDFILLHTVSSYPLQKIHSNLKKIYELKNNFDCPIGHSDHTPGTEIPPLAVAAGAQIIEKHFTDNPKLRESDNFFSVTEEEVKEIKFLIDKVKSYMGSDNIEKIETEDFMWNFRRDTRKK